MSDEKHKPWCSERARKESGGCICKTESSFAAPPCSANYPLFKFMSDTYQLTLLESEMNDIEAEVVRGICARDMKPLLWYICENLSQCSISEGQQVERAEEALKQWLLTRGANYGYLQNDALCEPGGPERPNRG